MIRIKWRLNQRSIFKVLLVSLSRNHQLAGNGVIASLQILHAPVHSIIWTFGKLHEFFWCEHICEGEPVQTRNLKTVKDMSLPKDWMDNNQKASNTSQTVMIVHFPWASLYPKAASWSDVSQAVKRVKYLPDNDLLLQGSEAGKVGRGRADNQFHPCSRLGLLQWHCPIPHHCIDAQVPVKKAAASTNSCFTAFLPQHKRLAFRASR